MSQKNAPITTGTLEVASFSMPISVECSPFEASFHLLAYGVDSSVNVLRRTSDVPRHVAPDDRRGPGCAIELFQFDRVTGFIAPSRVLTMAWSPRTICPISDAEESSVSTRLELCVACDDRFVYHYCVSETGRKQVQLLEQPEYVNDIAFRPAESEGGVCFHVALVGDHRTAQLWNLETKQLVDTIFLGSPGVSVRLSAHAPNTLFVAEQCGAIKFIDIRSKVIQNSVFAKETPLTSADWNTRNPSWFGASVGQKWALWNLDPRIGVPHHTAFGPPNSACSNRFRWSLTHQNLFSTICAPSNVSIWDYNHQSKRLYAAPQEAQAIGGLSWMQDAACLVAGDSRNLAFTLIA
ncbi:nucleoporin Nup37-like [Schistocerca gregaria]|uniref:nucleoporin Nup37-like n=1 Tax=Schistocerca gregaria TaxID=7010 RepID=UPI00211EB770|nr:nucleoporin Nup37-like [Schistocerca gregaria]